uniref:F-box domain-containing protein n=2 Tax=Rhizophagus irregularis (strain DAOM 181602 / DAOM 197198 / MUCL 43194) TaxID=747089 RepID=U9UVR1_RHIID
MTCSKIFSGDLPELTNEILQYFRNDFSTLHSCILVNRLWCRITIPLLWENPFSKKYPKNYHFIEIYFSKLNEDDKTKLNEYGIITELLFPSMNTLFNYPNFIQHLNTYEVCNRNSIETWSTNKMVSNFDNNFGFIFLSLIKIFIENEVNLYTFDFEIFCTFKYIGSDCFNSTLQLILQKPNFVCNIKNLNIYLGDYCDNNLSSSFIEESISKLINSQQNLKKICFNYKKYLKNLNIFNCLNTLKTIIFHEINLESLKINFNEAFEQQNVLESIHIINCYPLNSTFIQQIINLTKPFKLKSLFIDNYSTLQIETFKLLLQKTGNYLENIGFGLSRNNKHKRKLFKLVKIYCVKIKFLEIFGISRFNNQNIYSVLNLIKNVQQNLNYLSIIFY